MIIEATLSRSTMVQTKKAFISSSWKHRDLDGYDDFAPELVAKGSKEIESILSILNSDHETKDLEIKSNIFKVLPDLTSPESEAHAEEQLESLTCLPILMGEE